MTRSIMCGLLAVLSVGALGIVPVACQSGGVGDPCTPEDEYGATFGGFKTDLANIESRSFQCATRICLVNHFQGRVSCPLGQEQQPIDPTTLKPTACNDPNAACMESCSPGGTCQNGGNCVPSDVFSPACCNKGDPGCETPIACPAGLVCQGGACQCTENGSSAVPIGGVNYYCQAADPKCTGAGCAHVLQSYLCHKPGNCQQADLSDAENKGRDCCVPGTDTPVGVTVCGQCGANSKRNAANAVYCSCRCCAPCCDTNVVKTQDQANMMGCSLDMSTCGPMCDPNFNYCSCPSGYTCTNIREYVGLGDQNLAGAYCVVQGTAFTSNFTCGADPGAFTNDPSCLP